MPKFEIRQHIMTAIAYFLPIVVGSGMLLAFGNILGGSTIESFTDGFSFADTMSTMGGYGLGALPMIVATAISYSIADKPGIAPGLIVGFVAQGIQTGFLGGIIAGFIAGYLTAAIVAYIKVPQWMAGLMPTLVIPTFAALGAGLVMYYIVGGPINWLTNLVLNYLTGLDSSQKFMYGAIIGILASIDYGSALNKTVFAFVFALFSEGIYEPITVLIIVSMITPFGLTIAYFLGKLVKKNIFDAQDIETLKTAFPMGIVQITEGVFPIVLKSLPKHMLATGIGGAIAGGISMILGADSHIPASGMIAMFTATKPFAFLIATVVGSVIHAIVVLAILPRKDASTVEIFEEGPEEDIDWDSVKIS
ncbi:PTS fructose transporter subunit IIC [Eremococcus coleocola]|uniref:PTS fructose transporter subunit IIC n=1 Tax=Eremococcus coleocola TaxID=88132 RepID=UPI0005542160|nr:PTS fructose transporter subunit IIC [Eremococcus coleocola]